MNELGAAAGDRFVEQGKARCWRHGADMELIFGYAVFRSATRQRRPRFDQGSKSDE